MGENEHVRINRGEATEDYESRETEQTMQHVDLIWSLMKITHCKQTLGKWLGEIRILDVIKELSLHVLKYGISMIVIWKADFNFWERMLNI